MKLFELTKIKNCDDLIKQTPLKNHYSHVIQSDTIFTKNGKKVGIYIKITHPLIKEIRKAVNETKYVKTYRTKKALATQSSVFGSLPRIPLRNDYCRFLAQTKNEKLNAQRLFTFMEVLTNVYKEHLPEQFEHDVKVIGENVNTDYLLKENQPFATANINVNHAIKYHRDTGNFRGNLSNVFILKNGILGGELVFPEYGFALAQDDSYLAIFDGQNEIHGVMPIIKTKDKPYRASIVYYTLENMKHCYPFKMEIERLQKLSTQRANNRASNKDPRKPLKLVNIS
jgi:hypothetical protein